MAVKGACTSKEVKHEPRVMMSGSPRTDAEGAALKLLEQERYREAEAAFAVLPESPLVWWKRGAALHGLCRFPESLALLERARAALADPLERAGCELDIALAYIRWSRPSDAETALVACRPAFEAAGDPIACARWDLAELVRRQRAGAFAEYSAGYRPITDRLLQGGDRRWAAYALAQAALGHRRVGQYAACEAAAHEGLAHAEALGLVYRDAHLAYSLSVSAHDQNNFVAMRVWLDRARARIAISGGAALQGDIVLMEAALRYAEGDLEGFIALSRDAIAIFQAHGQAAGVGLAANNIGWAHFIRGELQASGAWQREAESAGHEAADTGVIAAALLGQGAVQTMLGNASSAHRLFLASHAMAAKTGARTLTVSALAFAAAVCPRAEFDDHARRAIAQFEQTEPSSALAIAMRVLGEHLLRHGRVDDAHPLLVKAETMARSFPMQWAMGAARLAECELARLERGDADIDAAALRDMLNRTAAVASDLPDILARVALALAALDRRDGALPSALSRMGEAIVALRVIRASGDDPVLASFGARPFEPVYRQGAALAVSLGDADAALSFAEHRRAQWLTRGLNAQRDPRPVRPELDDLARLLRRRRAMAERLRSGDGEVDAEGLAALRRATEEAARRYSDFDLRVMFDRTPAGGLREVAPLATSSGLRGVLNARYGVRWAAVVIEPLDEEDADWLVLRLTPGALTARLAPAGPVERAMLRSLGDGDPAFRRRFFGQAPGGHPALRELAEWLGVADWPEPGEPAPLLIADTGGLAQIPFAALPLPDGTPLAARAVLRFAPSLNAAARLVGAQRRGTVRVLAIAPLDFEDRHAALPHTATEVATLAGRWPGTVVLQGGDGSLAALRALADRDGLADFDVIHFATHALTEPGQVRLSGLALADGDLTLQEILGWRLTARLVSISACESAFQVTYGGDERIGLETALLAAGARSILSARWPVADEASSAVMQTFYRCYETSGDAAAALADTQRALANQVSAADLVAWRVLGPG